jgi:hypothetical protein
VNTSSHYSYGKTNLLLFIKQNSIASHIICYIAIVEI